MQLRTVKEYIKQFYDNNKDYICPYKSPKASEPYIMGLGANTFIVGDGESCFMIDAYLTRNCFRLPIDFSKKMLFAGIESKPGNVEELYQAAALPNISHIVCTHNHVDHTLDLKAIYDLQKRYNGKVPKIVGTLSSVNTALGYGVKEDDTLVIHRKKSGYEKIQIGKFKITFLPGKHLKLFALYKSTYRRKPLKVKGFITAYKEGGVLDLLIEHEGMKSVLLTSSFGIGEYTLSQPIGTLFQAIGGSGKETKRFKRALFKHNAIDTGVERVFLTHYDNFFLPIKRGIEYINVSHKMVEFLQDEDKTKQVGLLRLFEKIKL